MLRRTRTNRFVEIATIAFVVAAASGCSTTQGISNWFTGKQPPEDENVVLGAPSADDYLRDLNELVSADANKQADIVSDADNAARLTPGPSTNLRLGLVLATPGHAGSDPVRAQSVLNGVLSQSELMTSAEIALATVALNNVNNQIASSSEATRRYESTSRAARDQGQALSQQLASAQAENARLQAELDEAQQKLDAITSIERSIREQE